MIPRVVCAAMSRNLISCISRPLSSTLTNVKSSNVPESLKTPRDKFSGYVPIEELQITYRKHSKGVDLAMSTFNYPSVNFKTADSDVEVRFHVATATWLTESTKQKILEKHTHDMTKDGFLVLRSEKTWVQLLNVADCLDRLRKLVRDIADPTFRKPVKEEIRVAEAQKTELSSRERLRTKKMALPTKQGHQRLHSVE